MRSVRIPWMPAAGARVLCGALMAVVVLFTLSPAPAWAGMVLHEKTELIGAMPGQAQVPPGSRVRESTTYLEGKRIRTEAQGHVWVLDFAKGSLMTMNPAAKTYTEMSLKDLKEAQKQAMEYMGTLKAQMEERMKNMSPEAREAMQKKLDSLPEGIFGEKKAAKITVKATGKKETIHGFACNEYEVYEDGDLTTRYWLAPSVSTDAFDAYQKELSEWLEGMGPLGANRLKEWEYIRDKGFPIKVTRVKPIAGKISFNREILRVEEKSLSESLFQPPEGYKRTEAPALPRFEGKPGSMPPAK